MSDLFQWAIIAFVMLSILWHVWKGGAANPIGTGRLQSDMTTIKAKVVELEKSSKGTARASDVAHLRDEMERGKDERAQAMKQIDAKIEKVSDELDVLQKDCAGRLATVEATTTATGHQVDLIYRQIVAKGMS